MSETPQLKTANSLQEIMWAVAEARALAFYDPEDERDTVRLRQLQAYLLAEDAEEALNQLGLSEEETNILKRCMEFLTATQVTKTDTTESVLSIFEGTLFENTNDFLGDIADSTQNNVINVRTAYIAQEISSIELIKLFRKLSLEHFVFECFEETYLDWQDAFGIDFMSTEAEVFVDFCEELLTCNSLAEASANLSEATNRLVEKVAQFDKGEAIFATRRKEEVLRRLKEAKTKAIALEMRFAAQMDAKTKQDVTEINEEIRKQDAATDWEARFQAYKNLLLSRDRWQTIASAVMGNAPTNPENGEVLGLCDLNAKLTAREQLRKGIQKLREALLRLMREE